MKTLYHASRVHTLSLPETGEWVLVDERHVERVGIGDPPEADRVVDLPGTVVLPGFIDTHVHLSGTGFDELAPRLSATRSGAELLGVLAAAASARAGPALAHGFDETKWVSPTLPSMPELDGASPHPIVAVRADGHIVLANSAALRASGALEREGVEADDSGEPTGVLRQEAAWQAQRWFFEQRSDHEIRELHLAGAGLAASRGITCVHEMAVPEYRGIRDFEVLMGHRSQLPVDVVPYLATTDIPLVMDHGLPGIGGDLSLDGSIGARTAHLSEDYEDGPGRGVQYLEDDALAEFLHNAHLAGLQVAVHAIGDAAIAQALRCWDRVYRTLDSRERRHFRARRHRIEHFEMASDQQIEQAAILGLTLSVQPSFDALWGGSGELYERRLGTGRAAAMNPFRSVLARGLEVGIGSDAPVTPLDPMVAIAALERHHDPSQRMSRQEAIRLHTVGSAHLAHHEDKKGTLQPGAHADFAAYEADPTTALDLDDVRPVLTVSMGREVFAR